ncbi:O-antigen ligase family protein [Virgibacillus sp. W0181]|uniref:O-antigen ligase family protein n=1 Tax=Virgibacillus sp. W0181 TaxID=3391581 RepID=UPI003F45B576
MVHLIIFLFIIIQPVIDMATSLSTEYGLPRISIGALVKAMTIGILFIIIFKYLFTHNKKLLGMFIATFTGILVMAAVNLLLKHPYLLYEEVNFMLKTSYYVVMIFAAILLIDSKLINRELLFKAINVVSLIIGISFWLAIITKTNITSYTYLKGGYSGWFYAANELSVIVLILLGFTIVNLFITDTFTTKLAFILMVSMVPMIGTKTVFLGAIVLLFFNGVYLLLKHKNQTLQQKTYLLFFASIILFISFAPFSPIASNTKEVDFAPKQVEQVRMEEKEVEVAKHTFIGRVLSSRNIYFNTTKDNFIQTDSMRKLFGMGFAGDYEDHPKTIEMDFFDLFFGYGIIGTLLLLLPLAYLARKVFSLKLLTLEYLTFLLTLGLCFGISLLAGHVLFAPSVMTYVAILFVSIGLLVGEELSEPTIKGS